MKPTWQIWFKSKKQQTSRSRSSVITTIPPIGKLNSRKSFIKSQNISPTMMTIFISILSSSYSPKQAHKRLFSSFWKNIWVHSLKPLHSSPIRKASLHTWPLPLKDKPANLVKSSSQSSSTTKPLIKKESNSISALTIVSSLKISLISKIIFKYNSMMKMPMLALQTSRKS